MTSFPEQRIQMTELAHRLAARGLVAGTDGNLSCRLEENRILVTPGGRPLEGLQARDLVVVDSAGDRLEGELPPTSELPMHLAIYSGRPDVSAAVHAHPPYATAFAAAGQTIDTDCLPELTVFIGQVIPVPYETPGSKRLAEALGGVLAGGVAFLLANHGLLTLGMNLTEAYRRHEIVEHGAKILLLARQLGGAQRLSPDDLSELNDLKAKYDAR